jgi:hypothetical protein
VTWITGSTVFRCGAEVEVSEGTTACENEDRDPEECKEHLRESSPRFAMRDRLSGRLVGTRWRDDGFGLIETLP